MSSQLGEAMVNQQTEYVPMSYAEWVALPEKPKVEWVDGIGIVSPGATARHNNIARRLANLLEVSLPDLAVTTDADVQLSPMKFRRPDVLVLTALPDAWPITEAPILVAEIMSPGSRREDLMRKPREYAEAGIKLLWTVDPEGSSTVIADNVDGLWVDRVTLSGQSPTGVVAIAEYGEVAVDLHALLAH